METQCLSIQMKTVNEISCLIGHRLHYAGDYKRSIVYTVWPTVHENRAFRKHSSHGRNLKTPPFCFRLDGKQFENGTSRQRSQVAQTLWLPST